MRAKIKAHRGLTGRRRPGEVVGGGSIEAVAAGNAIASRPSPERFGRLLLSSLFLLLPLCFLELLLNFLGDDRAPSAVAVGGAMLRESKRETKKKKSEAEEKRVDELHQFAFSLALNLFSLASPLLSHASPPGSPKDNALPRCNGLHHPLRRGGGDPPGGGQALFSGPRPLALRRRLRDVCGGVKRRSPLCRKARR